jgi:hypothetical protein
MPTENCKPEDAGYVCEYCGSENSEHTIEECLTVCLAPESTNEKED